MQQPRKALLCLALLCVSSPFCECATKQAKDDAQHDTQHNNKLADDQQQSIVSLSHSIDHVVIDLDRISSDHQSTNPGPNWAQILAAIAAFTSAIAAVFSWRVASSLKAIARDNLRHIQMPVLLFSRIGNPSTMPTVPWKVTNAGTGPALDVVLIDINEKAKQDPIRCYPIAKGESINFPPVKSHPLWPTSGDKFLAYYLDSAGRRYCTEASNNRCSFVKDPKQWMEYDDKTIMKNEAESSLDVAARANESLLNEVFRPYSL